MKTMPTPEDPSANPLTLLAEAHSLMTFHGICSSAEKRDAESGVIESEASLPDEGEEAW